jgi:ureidoacrylate peracid hydrolase
VKDRTPNVQGLSSEDFKVTDPSPVLLQAEPESISVDLNRLAIIVIDMQNTFVSKGGRFESRGFDVSIYKNIIKTIQSVNAAARAKGIKVIYIAHTLSPDLRESGGPGHPYWHKAGHLRVYREQPDMRDKLIVRGTWGADIVKDLAPQEGDLLVEKPTFSAFHGTHLNTILRTFNIKYLAFVGTATNICVEASIRDAFNLGYFCILISDATVAIGPPFMQDATIYNVKSIYGWVTSSESILTAIG